MHKYDNFSVVLNKNDTFQHSPMLKGLGSFPNNWEMWKVTSLNKVISLPILVHSVI